jgi:phosphate transport system substrate-binding protein
MRVLLPVAWGLLAVSAGAAGIRVAGSDLLGGDFARAVAEFARQDGTPVQLALHGTRPGMDELAAGRADVGLFLLPAHEPAPGAAGVSRVIGYQVAVVAVPAASPLTQATPAQLRAWFGETPGERLRLFATAPAAGLAWPLFQRVILQGAAPKAAVEFVPDADTLARRLRGTENSLAVAGAGLASAPGLRVLALAASPTEPAYAPTPDNVHRGSYPLRLVLHVAFRRAEAPQLRRFLRFLLADETAAALAPAGYVPLPASTRNQLVFELEEMR